MLKLVILTNSARWGGQRAEKKEDDNSSSFSLFFVLGKNFLSACEGLLRQSTHHTRNDKNCACQVSQGCQSISALVRYYRS